MIAILPALPLLTQMFPQQLSQGIIAVPSFQKNFGERLISSASVDYYVTYSWQTAFNVTSYIGGLFGAILSGYLADIIGKRWTLAGACILSIGAVFLQVFAHHHHPEILLIGKVRIQPYLPKYTLDLARSV